MQFSHLHVHTQFSLLDGAADIKRLFKKAQEDSMPALAITDHGNMYGVFQFVAEAQKHKKADGSLAVKPIVGCEFYMVSDRHVHTFTKEKRDRRVHQLLLAKNEEGYRNLTKLCSLGFIEGLYGKYPRIDKELVMLYHKGLIATTCCIGAEVPQAILHKSPEEAEAAFRWWLDLFGEDYYIEIQKHGIGDQETVNHVLLGYAKKYGVKVIVSNDSHYVDQADANAHDILLCVNTGDQQKTPKATDEEYGKGFRFGFPNDQFFFKTTAEMQRVFPDLPHALDNTNEIVDKVTALKLQKDILLPNFPVPQGFLTQDDYLEHLVWEGARERYHEITGVVEERVRFELSTIRTMGFAGYFLIVSDFIKAGRDLGVVIGPGRGSAAGSVVAYCTGITNIDPLKYGLLFERFLNPERASMPDIDTDFDDEGRQKVIDYVVEKYGKRQVAHIVTYGTMAAKSSIKDVSRVLDLPLSEANGLAKLVPDKPGISLKRVLTAPMSGAGSLEEKEGLSPDQLENCRALRDIYGAKGDFRAEVLGEALKLEGSVRNTGIHAAGIIIAPEDLTNILPVATSKDVELLITQFEGNVIENAGVIKMDFLGLKNLTIIRDCLILIKENHGIDIDIEKIPIDDLRTFELYQRGDTNGTFQFESAGMQKYLRELKPDKFEDLIAMNALYRPGPIQYIPNFIARKNGREAVQYDLPAMSEYLEETYGITVYQEQVMLLSQKLAGFTKGEADILRKAMGKKQIEVLAKMKGKFMSGAAERGYNATALDKIWGDWEAFASYAFNKSHSTCYAWVAYQTAYLKANYTAEYMAAVLTHSKDISRIEFFLQECRAMNVEVLGPDVNESRKGFSVNKRGQIRFGMSSIRGVGDIPVEAIVEARAEAPFVSIWDMAKRLNLRTVTKRVFESLVLSGAMDGFDVARAAYFTPSDKHAAVFDHAMAWGKAYQEQKTNSSVSLFGGGGGNADAQLLEPRMPIADEWNLVQKLNQEKEVIGLYLSGHPLDDYRDELKACTNTTLERLAALTRPANDLRVGGIVTDTQIRTSKNGRQFGIYKIQDYTAVYELALFGNDFASYSNFFTIGNVLYLRGKTMPKWNSETEMEFKPDQVSLLEAEAEKVIRSVRLYLSLEQVTPAFVVDLTALCQAHKGKHDLSLYLTDGSPEMQVALQSKSIKIAATETLRDSLRTMGIRYELA